MKYTTHIIYPVFAIACIMVIALLSYLHEFDWFIFMFQLLILGKLIGGSMLYYPSFKQQDNVSITKRSRCKS